MAFYRRRPFILAVFVAAVLAVLAITSAARTGNNSELKKLQEQVEQLEKANVSLSMRLDNVLSAGTTLESRVKETAIFSLPRDESRSFLRQDPIGLFVRSEIQTQLRNGGYAYAWIPGAHYTRDPNKTLMSYAAGRYGSDLAIAQQLLDAGHTEEARTMVMVAIGELGITSCSSAEAFVPNWGLTNELLNLVRGDLGPRYTFVSDERGQTISFQAKNPGC